MLHAWRHADRHAAGLLREPSAVAAGAALPDLEAAAGADGAAHHGCAGGCADVGEWWTRGEAGWATMQRGDGLPHWSAASSGITATCPTKLQAPPASALLLLRCRFTISRRPLQQGQGGALLPGCAPVPPQCGQASMTKTSSSRCAPRIASRKPSCSRACTSGGPVLLLLLLPLLPLLVSAPQRDSSYCCRRSGSDSTSKAWLISCEGIRGAREDECGLTTGGEQARCAQQAAQFSGMHHPS